MSDLFDIRGKVAIVTGSSRGIGEAIARRLAEAGVRVVISSRKQDVLDQMADEMKADGLEVFPVAAHNGDKAALRNLVDRTVERHGTVDILINNAATNPHFGPILEAEDSMWQKTFEVNVMGNFWLTQAAVEVMRGNGGGKIINVASVNGLRPGRFQGVYSVTKAAVINLTQTLAMELASENIQVNAIAPGLIKTKFAQAIWDNDMLLQGILDRTPQGRIGDPDDIAGLALYLAAPASNFATGQVFVVDGGLTVPML
jgi:NAD(P)-dependent dehydrogenase (short-subunit alcohol dehydrogenase family)